MTNSSVSSSMRSFDDSSVKFTEEREMAAYASIKMVRLCIGYVIDNMTLERVLRSVSLHVGRLLCLVTESTSH